MFSKSERMIFKSLIFGIFLKIAMIMDLIFLFLKFYQRAFHEKENIC